MSLDIYVNEHYSGPMATEAGWGKFVDWADTLELEPYEEIVKLAEHQIVDQVALLKQQLTTALADDDDPVPRRLVPLCKRIIKACDDLRGEPEPECILWVTDGVNGLINTLIPDDDPDHLDADAARRPNDLLQRAREGPPVQLREFGHRQEIQAVWGQLRKRIDSLLGD